MAAVTPLVFEQNAIYIALLDRGDSYLFHWELYLATSTTEGVIFHATDEAKPGVWEYKRAPTNEMPELRRLVLALKIGSVEPVLHNALSDRLATVPMTRFSQRFGEQLSCRVWLKEALFVLDDEGYVNLGKGPAEFEEEAKYLGMMNKSKNQRKVMRSRMCMS